MIRAVAWDIDGTLVDSEPLHEAALLQVSARYGARLAPHDPRFVGMAMEDVFAILAPHYPESLALQTWLDEIVATYVAAAPRLKPLAGAREAVLALKRARVPQGCVSNSVRAIVEANLAQIGLADAFDFAIAREDATRGKPDPEPYALACRRFGAPPEATLAIEDSDVGAASARAAGLQVLRVDAAGEAFASVVNMAQLR